MKTTIDIDEVKLETVMRLGGFATRKEAIDWALTEAERIARLDRIAGDPWEAATVREAIDPGYDVIAIRRSNVPGVSE